VSRPPGRPRGIHIALALLTLCAVFAATAGVREALVTTTQALRQTVAGATSGATDITVSGTQSTAFTGASPASGSGYLTDHQVTEITSQLHADYDGYDHGVVKLAPASDDWASLTSQLSMVQSPLPKVNGVPVELEITYRQPLSQHMRLVAGQFPARPAPAVRVPAKRSGNRISVPGGSASYTPLLPVAVTAQTAATFGLRVGSKVQVPASGQAAGFAAITFQVSGIVVPTDPDSSFWTADAAAAVPGLQNPDSMIPPPFWVGGVIAGPGEAAAVQQDFSSSFGAGLTMEWGLPLALSSITAQQARPLSNALTSIAAQTPALAGDVAPVASSLNAASNLLVTLGAFFATEQSVDALLWLLYVSLTVTGIAVLLLAARMVATRRSAELTMVRARGASLWQVGLATGGAVAAVCVPAAVIAVALAVLAVHGPGSADLGSAGGWWPPVAVLVVAIAGPALVAAWEQRLPRHRTASRRQGLPGRVRLVVEVTLVAASVAGVIVFRQQGTPAGSGVNLYASAAPVLVAVPAVIVVLRIYPYVLRGLLRSSARSSGAPAFLGLARAVRSTLTPALPAFALVLALTVAAFAGMVRDAVTNGDVAASWKAVGADVTISGQSAFPNFSVPSSAVPAISAVPGVTHAAAEWPATWQAANGSQVTVLAVDPVSYAALVAATQGFPAVPAGLLTAPGGGAAQPVLASAQAVAALGTGAVSISTQAAAVRPVTVKVAGEVSATPGWPAGGAFLIMPLAALKSAATPPAPVPITELQLTGPNINQAQLDSTLQRDLPVGWIAIFRSAVLSGLTGAPLQHGAFLLITLSVTLAVVLGLAVMFLELALGAAEREATLARLATMGLGEGQRARVVVLEVLPAVIAAAVAAWACALVLPGLVAPSINLSVFNNTPLVVPLAPDVSNFIGTVPLVPDVASVALPLAGLILITAVALGIEIRSGRRRGVTTALRIGG
jgi:putative ABC transport system permease protein